MNAVKKQIAKMEGQLDKLREEYDVVRMNAATALSNFVSDLRADSWSTKTYVRDVCGSAAGWLVEADKLRAKITELNAEIDELKAEID